jgi:hypothetical protein
MVGFPVVVLNVPPQAEIQFQFIGLFEAVASNWMPTPPQAVAGPSIVGVPGGVQAGFIT